MADPFDLSRFVDAQESTYDRAVVELRRGRKTGHWIWYIFPQIAGLGFSATSRRYAITGREEARAVLDHPILGPRLRECVGIVTSLEGRTAEQIFGYPDVLKFRSCLTLFAESAKAEPVFTEALAKYYAGEGDPLTLGALAKTVDDV